uniref:PCI domain-containing protein n=1 Tax=Acrobeloides nanus TaxID=290746 RepID=A0A914C1I8_9BILA
METDQRNQILTEMASQKKFLGYDELMKALNLSNNRLLEDFLINAMYEGIIQGKLDPKKQSVEIKNWSVSRPVSNEETSIMIETLSNWIDHCKTTIGVLNKEVERSNEQLKANKEKEKRIEEEVEKTRKSLEQGTSYRTSSTSQENKQPSKEVKRHKGLKKRPGGQ